MRYSITNLTHDIEHFFGDDLICFHYDIHFIEPEELTIKKYYLQLSTLKDYLDQRHPEFYNYMETVRRGLDKWGPCEALTVEAMGEEALNQLYEYAVEFLMQSEWMPQLFENEKKMRAKPIEEQIKNQQNAEKVFRDLEDKVIHTTRAENPYYRFCEGTQKQIRALAMEVFPEIANLTPEGLLEFKYLFVSDIQRMYDEIQKLLKKIPSK